MVYSSSLDRQLQEYFDQLAPEWDKEVTLEGLECLKQIVEELQIKPGSFVLDIGSGTGVLLPFLIQAVGKEGKVIALDFSQKMLLQAKDKMLPAIVSYIQADAMNIPIFNNCFDLALCNGVFPHFNDKARALQEMARVLKAGQ